MEVLRNQIDRAIREDFIVRAKGGMFAQPYPGYPPKRYVGEIGDLWVPDGAWSKPNSRAPRPTPEATTMFIEQGLRVDAAGRPIHPWFEDMIADPSIGVIGESGAYWNYGPNHAADPIVFAGDSDRQILLIRRRDTGDLALPGGFIDPGESAVEAAAREAHEETGINLDPAKGLEFYSGVVTDRRTTAHAWGYTHAVLWQIPEICDVQGDDDALEAVWLPVHEIKDALFGSHAVLVHFARKLLN